ncbi:MAG: LysR substrate-binding domain-containing protein [Lautropia sp.]
MKHKQVEAFRAVMLARSMTVAATQLHTSQPNISRLIAQLQRDTGLRLFERVGSRVEPTPEAHAFFTEVERSFLGLERLSAAAHSIRQDGTGMLRVGASPLIAMSVLPLAIRCFRADHPDVTIGVYTSDSPTVCNWVARGACDFGLTNYMVATPGLEWRLWHRGPGVCLLPSRHRLARRRVIRAGDLEGEPFISLGQGDAGRALVDAVFLPDRRRLALETPFVATICSMVEMGLGVSVVDPLVLRGLLCPRVRALPFEPEIVFRSFAVHARQHVRQSLAHQLLRHLDDILTAGPAS